MQALKDCVAQENNKRINNSLLVNILTLYKKLHYIYVYQLIFNQYGETMYDVIFHLQVGLDGSTVDSEPVILPESGGGKNMLHIKLEDEGCFHAVVTCQGKPITNGVFDIVSLNRKFQNCASCFNR